MISSRVYIPGPGMYRFTFDISNHPTFTQPHPTSLDVLLFPVNLALSSTSRSIPSHCRRRHIILSIYIALQALQAMYQLSLPSRSISFPTSYYIIHSATFSVARYSCIRWELTSLYRPSKPSEKCTRPLPPSHQRSDTNLQSTPVLPLP